MTELKCAEYGCKDAAIVVHGGYSLCGKHVKQVFEHNKKEQEKQAEAQAHANALQKLGYRIQPAGE